MENKHIAGIGFVVLIVVIVFLIFTQKPQKTPFDTADQFNPFANKGQSTVVSPTPIIITQLGGRDISVGSGSALVKSGDTITVNYIGALADGKIFDSSYSRNKPFSFTIGAGQVIKGWEQGVIGMKLGGKRQLLIPADLAYGASGQGNIPPNSSLIFEIELLNIQESAAESVSPSLTPIPTASSSATPSPIQP